MALKRTIALNLENLIGETNRQHDMIAAMGGLESSSYGLSATPNVVVSNSVTGPSGG